MTTAAVAPEGVRTLDNLREQLQGAARADRAALWLSVQEPTVLEMLARDWSRHQRAMTIAFAAIESIHGCATRARLLRNTVERLASDTQRQSAQAQVDELTNQISRSNALSNHIDVPAAAVDPELMNQLFIPGGYQVDNTGVFRATVTQDGEVNLTRVAHAPIFVAGRTTDILAGEARRQVVWRGPSGWQSKVIDRRTILDSRRIIMLADYEAPVSSNTASALVSYLTEFEAENAHRYPAITSASRMGWLPDGSFLLADYHYTQTTEGLGYTLTAPPGLETMIQGWRQEGEWAEWLSAVELVKEYPLLMIGMYASAAAPLLHVLGVPGFVVDFSGETSGGKTTCLKFAASVWGRPEESYPTAMYSWDATKVWIERTAGFLHNLPLILDETKRAKHPSTVRDVIYDFCQGQGRGRGKPDGPRHTATWRSILISSGEGAATNFSQDAGTRARVISLKGKPLGADPKVGGPISEELQELVRDSHGHLGRRVVEYLITHHNRWGELKEAYKAQRTRYAAAAETAVGRRHASHIAVLDIVSQIVHRLGVPAPRDDPFSFLVEIMNTAAEEADRPLAAFADVASWAAANQIRFYGRHDLDLTGDVRTPHSGWAGAWSKDEEWKYIAILGPALRKALREFGFDSLEIISRWAERGWLDYPPSGGRSRTRPVRIDGAQTRCYCLRRSAIDTALGGEDDEVIFVSGE